MPRKQLGMVDDALLARVDARAAELGQTRRVFTERALLAALESVSGATAGTVERARAPVAASPPHENGATTPYASAAEAAAGGFKKRHAGNCKCATCKPLKGTKP